MGLLAYNISKMATNSTASTEEKKEMCVAADSILNLNAAQVVCSARIMAWMTLLQRQMWLRLAPSTPAEIRKELLDGPVSLDGLFGPQFQTLLDHTKTTKELQEQVREHSRSRPTQRVKSISCPWQDRQRQRHQSQRSPRAPTSTPCP